MRRWHYGYDKDGRDRRHEQDDSHGLAETTLPKLRFASNNGTCSEWQRLGTRAATSSSSAPCSASPSAYLSGAPPLASVSKWTCGISSLLVEILIHT